MLCLHVGPFRVQHAYGLRERRFSAAQILGRSHALASHPGISFPPNHYNLIKFISPAIGLQPRLLHPKLIYAQQNRGIASHTSCECLLCRLLREAQPVLERAAAHHAAQATRAACAESLAIAAFVGAESELDTIPIMSSLSSLWKGGESAACAAVSHWGCTGLDKVLVQIDPYA